MPTHLNIRIDRGGMVRKGLLNKTFFVLLDGSNIGHIDWGDKRSYTIPTGKHTLTLKYRPIEMWWSLDIIANDGETIELDSMMDMKKGKFTLFNKADGTTSDHHPARPSLEQIQINVKKSNTKILRGLFIGFCGGIGGFLFYLWHPFIIGTSSGVTLFFVVFIGYLLGGAVGAGISALRRK